MNISGSRINRDLPEVYIRADASPSIGFGHLMRMLVLADELRRNNFKVRFVVQDNQQAKALLDRKKYEYSLVPGVSDLSTSLPEADLVEFIELIKTAKQSFCIVDHPGAITQYLLTLSQNCTYLMAVAVDGLTSRHYPCDIVLNQNYLTKEKDILTEKNTIKLVGLEYALLRDEFLSMDRKIVEKNEIKNVFVNFGGSDPRNQSTRLAKIFSAHADSIFNGISFNIVVGPSFRYMPELKAVCDDGENLIVHKSPANIEALMASSDFAITAAGSTCWELAYLGVPGLLIVLSDNQKRIAKQLDSDSYYKNLGYYSDISDEFILNEVDTFINNYSSMYLDRLRLQKLVDGKGKQRIVSCINEVIS